MRPSGRIGTIAGQVGRRDHELKALGVCGRRSVTDIHVSTAYPLCVRRDTDLICPAIVAEHRADRMCAMAIVITRSRCICSAYAAARVNSIMPVIVVVRCCSVPAAILWF